MIDSHPRRHSRILALFAIVGILGLFHAPHLSAAERDPRADAAVAAGLAFVARQQADDGSFAGGGPTVATTSVALMSFLSTGEAQEVGRYGITVRRAIDFLVKSVPKDGYVGKVDASRMRGQALVALSLIEAYGVEPDPQQRAKIRSVIERIVAVIVEAQNVVKPDAHAGGWRDEPASIESDLFDTAWNALALRAARKMGIDVPKVNIDRAVAYIARCARADGGGFADQPGGAASPPTTASGVWPLCLLDSSERPEVLAAGSALSVPADEQVPIAYSVLFQTTQAALQVGDPAYSAVWTAARERLLSHQLAGGAWPQSSSPGEIGQVYSTSMAVMTLTTPMRVLTTFQK